MVKRSKSMYVKRGNFGGAQGYQVAVPGNRSKLFSDAKFGGSSGLAHAAALRHAQSLAPKARVNYETGRFVKARAAKNSRSGVLGVYRLKQVRPGKGIYEAWVACGLLPNGKQGKERFSVKKLGEKKAKAAAVAARRNMVKRILK